MSSPKEKLCIFVYKQTQKVLWWQFFISANTYRIDKRIGALYSARPHWSSPNLPLFSQNNLYNHNYPVFVEAPVTLPTLIHSLATRMNDRVNSHSVAAYTNAPRTAHLESQRVLLKEGVVLNRKLLRDDRVVYKRGITERYRFHCRWPHCYLAIAFYISATVPHSLCYEPPAARDAPRGAPCIAHATWC